MTDSLLENEIIVNRYFQKIFLVEIFVKSLETCVQISRLTAICENDFIFSNLNTSKISVDIIST